MAGRVDCQSTTVGAKPKNPALRAMVDSTLPSGGPAPPKQKGRGLHRGLSSLH